MKKQYLWIGLILLALLPCPAMAYVGPGAAITLLGSVLGFSSLVLLGAISTVLWPVWLVFKFIKRRKKAAKPLASDQQP